MIVELCIWLNIRPKVRLWRDQSHILPSKKIDTEDAVDLSKFMLTVSSSYPTRTGVHNARKTKVYNASWRISDRGTIICQVTEGYLIHILYIVWIVIRSIYTFWRFVLCTPTVSYGTVHPTIKHLVQALRKGCAVRFQQPMGHDVLALWTEDPCQVPNFR